MPLAAYALTDVDSVRSFLQKQTGDTGQNAIIEALINRASDSIRRFCKREFVPSEDATRVFDYDGSGYLNLSPFDLRSLTSITVDKDLDSERILETTQYRLCPKPSLDGVYGWIEQLPAGARSEITIVGDWGFAEVPAEVEHACIVTVAVWLRRDVQAFSSVLNEAVGITERPEALPAAAVAALSSYRRNASR